ncbi:TPA: conserved phage C-terminal domain-containing protein [Photobacterium damselae]
MQHLLELVGQEANLSIPRSFVRLCSGSYIHAAVLSQLAFWSSKSTRTDGWFYKSQKELAGELELSRDQVKRSIKYLTTHFGSAIKTKLKKANGVPTSHYQIDAECLFSFVSQVAKLVTKPTSESEPKSDPKPKPISRVKSTLMTCLTSRSKPTEKPQSSEPESPPQMSPNPLRNNAHPPEEKRPTLGVGKIAQTLTDPNHIQTTDPIKTKKDLPVAQCSTENLSLAKQIIEHLNAVTGSRFQCCQSNLRHITGRLNEGFALQDFRLVIEHKQREWGRDAKMAQYLRPSTLFSPSKFTGYLHGATLAQHQPQVANPDHRPVTMADFDDTSWAHDLGW